MSQVLVDIDEKEKRQRLKGHTQEFAIAFALINTSQGSPIRITRSFRMCTFINTQNELKNYLLMTICYKRKKMVPPF